MDRGLATLIGMSIAYAASLLGLAFAWYGWRRRREETSGPHEPGSEAPGRGRHGESGP